MVHRYLLAPLLTLLLLATFHLTQAQTGNVGIGTTTPTQTLDVNGSLRVRGLNGSGNRLPVVQPDGTLGINAPVYTATPNPTTGSVTAGGYPNSVAVSGNVAYVVDEAYAILQVFDVSTPSTPTLLGQVSTRGQPITVAINGGRAYVVSDDRLEIYNVATPSTPTFLGQIVLSNTQGLAVSGTTAYVTQSFGDQLYVIDASTPSTPMLMGQVATDSQPVAAAVSGTQVYVVNDNGGSLQVFDVATPSAPALLGRVATGGHPQGVAVSGTTVYVANTSGNTLQAFNVATPSAPTLLSQVVTYSQPIGLTVSGSVAYVTNQGSNILQLFNIATPSAPVQVDQLNTQSQPVAVAASGTAICVVNQGSGTLQVFMPATGRVVTVAPDGSLASVAAPTLSISGQLLSISGGNTIALPNLTGDITSTGGTTTYSGILPASKGGAGTVSGLLKADGNGQVSAAVVGTDYLSPAGAVQNTTTVQPNSNFNISGAGTVGGLLTVGSAIVGRTVGAGTTSAGYPLTIQASVSNRVLGLNNAAGTDRYNFSLGSTGLNLSESSSGSSRLFVQDGTGNVGLGTTTPATSALLDVSSTNQGFLPPRLTISQRDAIASPAPGLVVYNTVSGQLNVWNGISWTEGINATETGALLPQTFGLTQAEQLYTVPPGITRLQVDVRGAQGGASSGGYIGGGAGGRVQAVLAVTPGEVLRVYVGGAGSNAPRNLNGNGNLVVAGGYNGGGETANYGGSGGGGGASDIRQGGAAISNRVVVGGGGGGTCSANPGGSGGGLSGAAGTAGPYYTPGTGGTQSGVGTSAAGAPVASGAQGGGSDYNYGGGGGGGYFGGGAGGQSAAGGGGSGFADPAVTSSVTMTNGTQSGNGLVTITPLRAALLAPTLSGANITGVPGTWSVSGTSYYYNGGNVGIGTSTPTQKLDVAGNANVSGNSTVGGLLTAGSATVSGATALSGATTLTGPTAINTTGSASTTLGSATGAVVLPGLSTAGFVTNSASGQLGTTTAASLGTNFVLNQTSPQTGASFNVSGTGTVGGALTAGSASVTGSASVGGRLGVGTSSPAGQLANTAGNVIATDGNGISQQGLGWVNTSSAGYAGVFYNANNAANGPGLAVKITSPAAAALDVSQGSSAGTAGTPLLRVQGSGQVGIGTAAPVGGLHVTTGNGGPGTGAATAGVVMSGAAGQPPYLELRGSGTGTSTSTPYLDFAETNDQDYATRLISQSGVLNVNGTGTNGVLLQVNGGLRATNYANISDARFKQHVRPLAGALASVLALRGVRYEWNALGIQHGGTAGAGQVGVLAQEIEKVYPELVSTDKEGYKSVNYAQLTPVLIEALKEQQAQLEVLKAQAATAEAKAAAADAKAAQATATLDTFEARLRRLEAATGGQAQR